MQDIIDTYTTVSSHLSQNIAFTTPAAAGISPISHTMLDLLIIFVRYLPAAQSIALFTKLTTPTLLEHTDATVQKKSYRVLKGLLEAKKVPGLTEPERLEQFVKRINEVGGGVGPGAQRVSLMSEAKW